MGGGVVGGGGGGGGSGEAFGRNTHVKRCVVCVCVEGGESHLQGVSHSKSTKARFAYRTVVS